MDLGYFGPICGFPHGFGPFWSYFAGILAIDLGLFGPFWAVQGMDLKHFGLFRGLGHLGSFLT